MLQLLEHGIQLKTTRMGSPQGEILMERGNDVMEKTGYPILMVRWARILETFRAMLPGDCLHNGYAFRGEYVEVQTFPNANCTMDWWPAW